MSLRVLRQAQDKLCEAIFARPQRLLRRLRLLAMTSFLIIVQGFCLIVLSKHQGVSAAGFEREPFYNVGSLKKSVSLGTITERPSIENKKARRFER